MAKNAFKLEIPKRSSICCKGFEKFSAGMHIFSVVKLNAENMYERFDYCTACWSTEDRMEGINWKTTIPATKEAADLSRNRELHAYQLLKEKLENPSHDQQAEAFILALYLARKRLLILRKEQKVGDGTIKLLYEWLDDEEFIQVTRVNLADCNLDDIQQKIANALAV